MKNRFSLFLWLIIPVLCSGQKKYSFDYASAYDFRLNENSKVEKRILLTNSNDNSYLLEVIEKDSLHYTLEFKDQKGYFSQTILSCTDFFRAETINLDCASVLVFTNPYKYQVKNYDYHILNDTLIDDVNYARYLLKSNKPKREKRKKLANLFFVVEKSTNFHLPILINPTSYEEWKLEKNIPNGIPKLLYFTSYKTKKVLSKYTLLGYQKIEKYIVVPPDCPRPIKINYRFEFVE